MFKDVLKLESAGIFVIYFIFIVVLTAAIIALAGPVSCLAKVYTKLVVSPFHVNPSWCITLADLLVRTEQCLRTNKAIDKRNCSWRISGRVINGHPLG